MNVLKLINSLPTCEIFGRVDVNVKDIQSDSRSVRKGSLFVAIRGLSVDAHRFIPAVIRSGASVVVGEETPKSAWLKHVTYIKVPYARAALGYLASCWYGNPSEKMRVIGITGTDGKTTTANLLWRMLNESGKKAGLISTIGARVGNKIFDTGLHVTNPEALELQRHLALMVRKGCKYAVLEVSSHGIDQGRVTGVRFDTAVLTNITHEHFDYHKNIRNYKETKAKIFSNVRHAVLNRDDRRFKYFSRVARKSIIHPYSYQSEYEKEFSLPGRYNLYNLSAATTVARIYKCPKSAIHRALRSFPALPGRMQEIKEGQDYKVFVDFAHTPNGLKSVLADLRIILPKGNKLTVLFGCAGERDTSTRAVRGKIATLYAHRVIITADDPRREKLADIYRDIISDIKKDRIKKVMRVDDRGEAIKTALSLARAGDIVLLAGKGHERSISVGGKELPWSDARVAKSILKKVPCNYYYKRYFISRNRHTLS